MGLKPLTIKGSHPSQPKPKQEADGVSTAIWPRAFEGGRQLGGKAVNKPEDLRGPSLDDSHRAGYATNSGATPSEERARVLHTQKIGKVAPPPRSAFHPKGHPKRAVKTSGRTAPSAHGGEGHHRG